MFDAIFNSIERTFVNFNIRRLFFLVTILSVTIIGFYVFESYTRYGFYYRMDKKIELLTQLKKLKTEGIDNDPDLKKIYDSTVSALANQNSNPELFNEPFKFFTGELGTKILSALAVPFLMLFVGLLTIEKTESKSFVAGILIYGIICLTFGIIIPSFDKIWVNAIINFVFSLFLFAGLMKVFGNKN